MKGTMKKLINLTLLLAALFALPACSTTKLETGGAYAVQGSQPDLAFYTVDASFDMAYAAFDTAFTFERENRKALWALSPSIKHALDAVRPTAVQVVKEYGTARKAYMANPTPAGLTTLQTVIAKAQQLAETAKAALPN
jgi:hypothetical protein